MRVNLSTNDHLVLDNTMGLLPGSKSANIAELGIGKTIDVLRRYVIHFPSGARVMDRSYAPQGDKIAWLLSLDRIPPIEVLLHRWFPAFQTYPSHVVGLWISRIDGSNWREVGHIASKKGIDETEIGAVKWLPSGKRLSFIYHAMLYTVPAD